MNWVRGTIIGAGLVLALLGSGAGSAVASVSSAGASEAVGGPEGISCPTTNWCAAVGTVQTGLVHHEEVLKPVAWVFDAGHWAHRVLPVPPGASAVPEAYLGSVSCPSAGSCVAVGVVYLSGRETRTNLFAETLSRGRWSVTTMRLPAGSETSPLELHGTMPSVSCTSLTDCVAVSSVARPRYVVAAPAAWRLRGTSWTATVLPSPPGTTVGNNMALLESVSCAHAPHCTAVGEHENRSHHMVPFIETYTNGRWTAQDGPVHGTDSTYLKAVDCPKVTACVAVGLAQAGPNHATEYPAVATERSGRWQLHVLPPVAGTRSAAFHSVSCLNAGTCLAVGWSGDLALKPYAERLTAGRWRPDIPAEHIPLDAVACAASERCLATTGLDVPARDRVDTLGTGGWSSRAVGLPG